jgi:hypothetical protein
MGKRKYTTHVTTRTITDSLGQLVEVTESRVFKTKSDNEPFFMVYCKQLACLYDLSSVTAIKVLVKFMEQATFNKGIVTLSTALRTDIINNLKISKSSLSKAIKALIDSQMVFELQDVIVDEETGEEIKTLRKGEYMINPEIA